MKDKNNSKKGTISSPLIVDENIPSDVDGSYTGVPLDGGEPVQDADDL
jgi:hypothetical protein